LGRDQTPTKERNNIEVFSKGKAFKTFLLVCHTMELPVCFRDAKALSRRFSFFKETKGSLLFTKQKRR
jgi:hypothetical protein